MFQAPKTHDRTTVRTPDRTRLFAAGRNAGSLLALVAAGLAFVTLQCAPPEHLTDRLGGITGGAGVTAQGTGGTTGAAGTTPGTAGDSMISGTGGTAAGGTTGSAGTGAAGTNAAGGTTGTAGTNAAAGTTGTAGTGAAGTSAAAGTTGTAGTGAAGTGAAGTGAAGTGGPAVNGCLNTNWTFVPNYVCEFPANQSCNFQATARLPANAIDGVASTRYTTGKTQSGDEFFVLTFGGRVKITGITIMTTDANDYIRAYRAEYSATDGTTFTAFAPAVTGAGSVNLAITFPATTMKAIKIYQTGMVVAPATSWWSIHEVTIQGCVQQ